MSQYTGHVFPSPRKRGQQTYAANDQLLLNASDPTLKELLSDLNLVHELVNKDGLSLDHVRILRDCAERSEQRFRELQSIRR